MCGLAGLFLPRSAGVVEANLDAMISSIRHRGPDGNGLFVSPDRRYQAGFARLAIIDLETGDQPIVESRNDGNGGRVLMGNGEIYNYVELRASDAGRHYPYKTRGDIETVLPLESVFGDEFVHHLNGMYALALYEPTTHRLTLLRDRLGIKPLYWARLSGGGILFASEIKALFASGLLNPAIDEDAVSSYLAHGYVPSPMTLYKSVHKLAPGCRLTVSANGKIDIHHYWRPTPSQNAPGDPPALREHLVGLMRESVRIQLRSDAPVGALLSGGIDSGLIVALAAGETDRPLRTYTVRFEDAAVDESPLAAQVAARYGADHTVFDLPSGGISDYLPQLAWHADEPLSDPSLLPNFLIERELSQSVKVALNGTGGDELFAGYGRYFQQPVEAAYLSAPAWLRNHFIEPLIGAAAPMTAWKLARAEKFYGDPGGYLFDHGTLFPAAMRRLIGNCLAQPSPAQAAAFAEFMARGSADRQSGALAADLATYLPEDLLTLLDRTSMAVSVEGRVPLLDHRLVEAALTIPAEIRAPGGRQKALQRDIARDFLPADVIDAPKQGFASPVASWIQAGLGPLARRILTRREALEHGWWNAAGIDKLLADPVRHGARIYSLLMLEMTIRIHVEDPRRSAAPTGGLEDYCHAA